MKPPSQNEPISVIIPTVNAYEELDLAIESIKKNSDHPIDFVIIVDPDMNTGKIDQKILVVCRKHGIKPIINKKNLGLYGNWNKGAAHAKTDWLIFATDDQYFAPHWDSNLLKYWQPKRLIAGRLVEPGIIPVWRTNIKKDFGILPSEFKEKEFIQWCESRPDKGFEEDGFFIPMLQHRSDYEALGGYPTKGKFGTSSAVSNDVIYVQEAIKKGYQFGTAADSYSYHFQASSWKKKTLKPKIAVVILTHNSAKSLPQAVRSAKPLAAKIIIVDDNSTDKTREVAKRLGCSVYRRTLDDFATQRNWALAKVAKYDWVLMLDHDEILESKLVAELKSFAKDIYLDGVRIPRKNYIFGKWIQHSDWYPDYRLVFFRPKIVKYEQGVHERAVFIKGNKATADAKYHLIHRNYDTVEDFLVRNLIKYPRAYAQHLHQLNYQLKPTDFIQKPIAEFMRRFFLTEGYKDGFYGLVLATLMAAQTVAAYAYLWEVQGKRTNLTSYEINQLFASLKEQGKEVKYWLLSLAVDSAKGAKKFAHRLHRKLYRHLFIKNT